MSVARQTVTRGEIFIGFGKRPLRQPFHHVAGQTGIKARTCGRRKNPLCSKGDMLM